MKTNKPISRALLIERLAHTGCTQKKPWVWILAENGERQYTSWRSFSSKAKAEAHFFSGRHGITRKDIKVGVVK